MINSAPNDDSWHVDSRDTLYYIVFTLSLSLSLSLSLDDQFTHRPFSSLFCIIILQEPLRAGNCSAIVSFRVSLLTAIL